MRRKLSTFKTEPGSVGVDGHSMTIRVIDDDYIVEANMNAYRYEIVSRRSRYVQNVDPIYSEADVVLKAGHTYRMRVNQSQAAPRIVKVFAQA